MLDVRRLGRRARARARALCQVCGGRGVVNDNQGMFSFSHPCVACGGTGMRIEVPAPTCAGHGTEKRARQVKVRIPRRGRERPADQGPRAGAAPGRTAGPAGDLYVVVHIAPHPRFGQKGKDLTVRVPVTFAEAALGTDRHGAHARRQAGHRKVPPGTRSGKVFRVAGQGVPGSGKAGDLLVTFEVEVPAKLTRRAARPSRRSPRPRPS